MTHLRALVPEIAQVDAEHGAIGIHQRQRVEPGRADAIGKSLSGPGSPPSVAVGMSDMPRRPVGRSAL